MDGTRPTTSPPLWRPRGCDGIGLVLQGGGALGAYQAGVYEALHDAGLEPDWVAGVSTGAINDTGPPGSALRDPGRDADPGATQAEGDAKDLLSRLSMRDNWRANLCDTRATLTHRDWLEMTNGGGGIRSRDIHVAGG